MKLAHLSMLLTTLIRLSLLAADQLIRFLAVATPACTLETFPPQRLYPLQL